MSLRKLIFWLHLCAGCVAGVVILIMSVTGVALAYEKQITQWAERDYRVKPSATKLSLEALLTKVHAARPGTNPASITMRADPAAPATVSIGSANVLVNPYTGELLGEGATKVRAFMRTMIEWHRYLALSGDKRPLGKAITGACNLAFLFLVISGFYLWFPRKWTASAVKSVTLFGRGLRGKARDWNWHNVIGFWCALPLLFIVGTAPFFNYPWATASLYRITGHAPPAPPAPRPAAVPAKPNVTTSAAAPAKFNVGGLDAAWTRAAQEAPDWRTMTLRWGNAPTAPVTFAIERGTVGQPHRKLQLSVARGTGELISVEKYEGYTLPRKIRLWIRWIHTGEAGGLPGQAIAMIASASGAMLVCTGLSLALRRLRGNAQG